MSQFFQIHPENPQARLIKQAADIVRGGGVIAATHQTLDWPGAAILDLGMYR